MSRGTIHRTIRIDDALWLPAKAKADATGIHLSDVIRDALREFIAEPPEVT
jgi:antitoxin component of RelBE/YafQ-DinJ toxin-antitoxin module